MNSPELAESLVKQLKKIVGDESMWSIADIAAYMNLSKSTISNRILPHKDFPAAIQIPYGHASKTERRWYPTEVKKWISRHRSKH